MKVLHAIQMTAMAGAEKHLVELLPKLNKSGVEVQLICFYVDTDAAVVPELCVPIRSGGVKVHEVRSSSRINWGLLRKLSAIIKEEKPDAVHSHLISADGLFSLIKLLFFQRFFLVSTKHNYSYEYTSQFGYATDKKLYDRYFWTSRFTSFFVNHDISVSEGLRQVLIAQNICSDNTSDTIYHGLRQIYDSSKNTTNNRNSNHQLVIVGRLQKMKGHQHIFKCLPDLIEKFPDLHLNIVGQGPQREEWEQLCKEQGLSAHVTFHGYVKNPLDYLRDADVVLMPSIGEGFGLVFLEAFEVGTPVIAFDVPAANEIIDHEINGILVEAFKLDQMTREIAALLRDKTERQRLSENARASLDNRFTVEKMVEETAQLYRRILGK